MATLTTTPIKTFVSGETVTPAKLNELSQSTVALTAGTIVDADVSASAAIALSKLATGALPAAITVASANLVDGTIATADIANAAVTAPKLQNGVTLQTVYAQTTDYVAIGGLIPLDNTKPQNTEGDEVLAATITPSSATSKILVQASLTGTLGNTAGTMTVALFKDSAADALAASWVSGSSGFGLTIPFAYQDAPNTTSAVTYKIRLGYPGTGSGLYLNRGVLGAAIYNGTMTSSMTLTEIKA